MLCASVTTYYLIPNSLLADTVTKIVIENAVPKAFGDWQVDEMMVPISPSPEQKEAVDKIYDQVVSRTYLNSKGERIMLSIAYGSAQTRKMRAHRQEVCYQAQGFQIKDLRTDQVAIAGTEIPVTRMVAVQGSRIEPVTYWFTMGDFLVRSYLDRQLVQLTYAFSGYVPDGYLLRVSSIDSNTPRAFNNQLIFSRQLMDAVSPELRRKLIGSN
jgi:EpsI family protein